MASDRQIAANRANCTRSTGPVTFAGKMKSSRNAFRHGLSTPLLSESDPLRVQSLAVLIGGSSREGERMQAATETAQSHLDLLRVRAVRAELLANRSVASLNAQELRQLASLDRYERYARTKRRKAAKSMFGQEGGKKLFAKTKPIS